MRTRQFISFITNYFEMSNKFKQLITIYKELNKKKLFSNRKKISPPFMA